MFNIIVVDDEVFAVEGIKSAVNWSKLGIDEVFTAFNIRQAKEVFENNRVDIMLCDIEMPQGNGIELLSWVRANRSKTECIFLTCHADFGYAKEALKLGSLDYILKPIPYDELEEVIKKAIDKIKKDRKLTEESQLGQYWNKNRAMIVETFWRDVINHSIASDIKAIEEAAKEKNIQFNERVKLIPVLIKVHQWGKNLNSQEENLMDFALKNIAAEKFFGDSVKGQFVKLEQKRFIVIINSDVSKVVKEKLKEVCEKFIEACNQYISCDLCCYIGDEVYINELSSNVNQLVVIDENNVAFSNKVFLLNNRKIPASTIKMPDMAPWSVFLNEGSKDKVIEEIQSFLQGQVNSIGLNANMLYQFQQDFLQMIYTLLKQKGIQAHQLLGDEKTKELYSKAISSIKAFMLWVSHVVDKSMKYIYDVGRSQSVVDRAKKYISDHISEEITRDDIASFVFLNPDYLNRIFKKETNMSISEYLQQERFNIARELLAKTDFPVSSIAVKVGYTNFSHFAKMFKKYTGMNPMEYRQKNGSV
ncbi:response regulator [Clostridium sp. SYSU_GA19001]|uniref:response regulator transcription factor n=1 Tax=Clostridium caldaquaticum TaxID=2940653 RepID=UPI002077411D|nr:response regulator [Clostridium caldaquaticum]MCM8710332.1 response regulator [Clostridium caldaquaticum]